MSEKKVVVNNGTGLLGAVGVVLVILKLAAFEPVASWSWWLVTMPFWLGLAVILAVLLIVGAVGLVVGGISAIRRR